MLLIETSSGSGRPSGTVKTGISRAPRSRKTASDRCDVALSIPSESKTIPAGGIPPEFATASREEAIEVPGSAGLQDRQIFDSNHRIVANQTRGLAKGMIAEIKILTQGFKNRQG
jgi:hypothetical protein